MERFPLFLSVRNSPWIPLEEEELAATIDLYTMIRKVVRLKDHPYRTEVVKHLIQAFFFGLGYQFNKIPDNKKSSKQTILVEEFLNYAQANYKEQRGMKFYADKLCMTPKHMSKVIKETSGVSASDWIDNYVILEAKALLNSTNMTIQQISDELNFPHSRSLENFLSSMSEYLLKRTGKIDGVTYLKTFYS
jgi:AraC-like DNA-binding protein